MPRYLTSSAFLVLAILFQFGSGSMIAEEIDVWIGTSSATASKGIYHCRLDLQSGVLGPSKLAATIKGPGFLALHPKGDFLYAVGTLEGVPSVVAYRVNSGTSGSLLELDSSAPIGDGGAAHVSVHRSGKMLLTAQYGAGSTAVFKLAQNGSIVERTQLLKHSGGSGVVGNRQDSPHAHWTGYSPDGRFAFVPDLGLDRVLIYKISPDHSTIQPHGEAVLPPGAGPRHMKFHPNGRWAYVLNELDLSVSVFDYVAEVAQLKIKQTIPTVDKEILAKEQFKSCSEIRVHPNGRFVYAANRGHDTLTVFEVDATTGTLSPIELENVRGATPRNFNLAPGAKWLLVGGQDSHTLACFAVASQTGELTYNRSIISTPAPICVLFEPED